MVAGCRQLRLACEATGIAISALAHQGADFGRRNCPTSKVPRIGAFESGDGHVRDLGIQPLPQLEVS